MPLMRVQTHAFRLLWSLLLVGVNADDGIALVGANPGSPLLGRTLSNKFVFDKKECFEDPTQPDCSDCDAYYSRDDMSDDLDAICSKLPTASACSIRNICAEGRAHGTYCETFSLLADLCGGVGEAMNMQADHAGCTKWHALCDTPSTAVTQCTTRRALPSYFNSSVAESSAAYLCKMMPDMHECEACTSTGTCKDPLLTYSKICLAMEMDGCEAWSSMCSALPADNDSLLSFFCKVGGGDDGDATCSGIMRMYFHTGYQDFVLLKSWVPCTLGNYCAACMSIVMLGVLVALLKVFRVRLEKRFQRAASIMEHNRGMRQERQEMRVAGGGGGRGGGGGMAREGTRSAAFVGGGSGEKVDEVFKGVEERDETIPLLPLLPLLSYPQDQDDEFWAGFLPENMLVLKQNVVRGALVSVTLVLDYLLMLIAMTFNVGLFAAVILGVGLGTLLFGHNGFAQKKNTGPVNQLLEERSCCPTPVS